MITRIVCCATTPTPLKIPITPVPKTLPGVILRMLQEIFVFRSILRANFPLWIGTIIFHL